MSPSLMQKSLRESCETVLDQAVFELNRLKKEASSSAWAFASKLCSVYESELWKTRLNEQGNVAYRTFEQFSKTELGITRRYAQDLLKIAKRFTENEFLTIGPAKLKLVLVAPEKDQKQLLVEIKAGASKRDIERKIRPGSKARDLKTRSSSKETGTIATFVVCGRRELVKMFARPNSVDVGDPHLAESVEDHPYGWLDMPNGVRLWAAIVRSPSKKLSLRLEFRQQTQKCRAT